MNMLITGGAGYIGTSLARLAARSGATVTVVDNLMYHQGHDAYHGDGIFHSGGSIRFMRRDVRDVPSYRHVIDWADVVVHLAAIVGAPACAKSPTMANEVNHRSVADVVAALSGQVFILPNTNSGYGTVIDGVCTEETPLKPISLYGVTKQAAEEIARTYPRSVVLRLATVFGLSPRMRLDLLVNQFAYLAHFNKSIDVHGGGMRRNFVSVGDVCRLIMYASSSRRLLGQVYNVGNDGINMTKLEMARLIAHFFGADVREVPGTDPDARDYLVSSQKLKQAGFQCLTSVEEELLALRNWMEMLPADEDTRWDVIKRMNTTCE